MKKHIRFIVYGLIGLTIETLYTGLHSFFIGDLSMQGFTFLIMLPIYGLAVYLEPVHNRLRPYPWWLRGFAYLFIIWGIEYSAGWFLDQLLGYCPWYYSDALSINSYITIRMAPEWFLAGLLFEKLHDFLDRLSLPTS